MSKVAYMGLGAMGSRMAGNLLAAGHELTVWNRTPERAGPLVEAGARAAATPREAAQGAEFIFSSLRDDPASQQVWFDPATGAAGGMSPDAVALESSTLSIAGARAFHAGMAERGLTALDAPVLGSLPQAQAKSLIFVVGGPRPAFDRALPVMKAMGGTVRYAGEAGAGAAVKLAANTMLGLQVAGMAELIGMLERAGVDVAHALDIIGDTPVSSLAAKVNAQFMLAGDHEPRFPVELIEKDMAYSVAASGAAESAPMAEAARQVFRRAMAKGLGGANMTAIAKLYD